jgi:RNA polymerase sigma-70 factor (ECF subfamily)
MFFNAVEKSARARISALWQSATDGNADRSLARMTVHERVEEIYEAERENIYSYLLCFRVPAGRAQELTQDSFLKLYLKMAKGEQIENPRAWLYRVAHNFALRYHEREPAFDQLDPNFPACEIAPDPERALIELQRRSTLLQAIRDLSPQQRNCVHLRVQGLRYREISEVIGISTSAVGEFLRRAVARLKEAMDGQ